MFHLTRARFTVPSASLLSAITRLTVTLLLSARAHATEQAWPTPTSAERDAEPQPDESVSVSLSNRAGVVDAPFVTTAFPEVSGFADVLTGTAGVHFRALGWLRLRVPITVVRLDFPAAAQVTETAFGNVELELEREYRFPRFPSTRVTLLGAIVAPSAQHGSSAALLANRALALGSALNGGKHSARLTPGVTGVRLGATLEHSQPPFAFSASLDVPLLVRISDASLPSETETRPLGVLPALDLRATLWITWGFGASLSAGLITEPLRVQEPALERDRDQRVQAVTEPALHLRLGDSLALGLDGSIPVAGRLGGDAWSIGLHARLGL